MRLNRVEKHQIKKNHPMFSICKEYCHKSKNLYNYGNYIVRQKYITSNEFINYKTLWAMVKHDLPFKDIGSNSGQYTLKILEQNWKSYFAAIKGWSKDPSKYLGKPRLPNYLDKETGKFVWTLTNVQSKVIDGELVFSFKPIRKFNGLIKTRINGNHMQTRIVPKGDIYILEIVYQVDIPDIIHKPSRIVGIDLGLNNLITAQNNFGENPFVINGKPLKSMNKFYNKKTSELRSKAKRVNNKNWTKKLSSLTLKRENKIDHYMHNASSWILNYCLAMKVDTVVIGKNDRWKQNKRLKNFIQVPFEKIIHQLEYKLQQNGIVVILTEESYTSKASFLNMDQPSRGSFNGERIARGMYKTNDNRIINADVNGAGNIIRKVFPNAFADGIEGVGLHPSIINI